MRAFCKIRLLVITALSSFVSMCGAVTTGVDFSDLWYNASESGWGMNVIQQQDILFITLFVYGPDGKPTWYVASSAQSTGTNAAGDQIFTGTLYQTTGPAFISPVFNSSAVTATPVGNITFTGLAGGDATVTYSVNGSTVTKSTARQTWRAVTLPPTEYQGSVASTNSGCADPASNRSDSGAASLSVTVNGSLMTLVSTVPNSCHGGPCICTWSAAYTQDGRFGRAVGTGTCNDTPGVTASITVTDILFGAQSFSGNYVVQNPLVAGSSRCREVGTFAGARKR